MAVFFVLAACSEDVYQEIDQQNEEADMMAPPTFNDNNPGWFDHGSGSIHPGDNYASPWDVWWRNNPFTPGYIIINGGFSTGHTSPFYVEVTPWIGLAYFDSNDDGFYHDPFIATTSPPGLIANFWSGNYPNLFAGGQEIGNLIPGAPIVMDGTVLDQTEVAIGSTSDHLPINPGTLGSGYNPRGLFFDLSAHATPQEIALLRDYGKVFYYEVHITDNVGGSWHIFVEADNTNLETSPVMPWINTGLQVNNSGLWTGPTPDIHYYHNTTLPAPGTTWPTGGPPGGPGGPWRCDSREVVFRRTFGDEQPLGIGTWRVVAGLSQGSWLWQTSSFYVIVAP